MATYNRLAEILSDREDLVSMMNNYSQSIELFPYLVKQILQITSDQCIYNNTISDDNMRALTIIVQMYMKDCWSIFVGKTKTKDLLKFARIEKYSVNADRGLRAATNKEIAQGVRQLRMDYLYPVGENEYRLLNLLEWTFEGYNRYFIAAGHKLHYEKGSINPNENVYEQIMICAEQLLELFKWVAVDENVDNAFNRLTKFKKQKGYQYANYADDEITEIVSVKQIMRNIGCMIPTGSDNENYRKATWILMRNKDKPISTINPMDIAFLRNVYEEITLMGITEENNKLFDERAEKLKNECNALLEAKNSGKIYETHFVFKIINTLQRGNYMKCSSKQYDIIDDALKIIKYGKYADKTSEVKDSLEEAECDDVAEDDVAEDDGNGISFGADGQGTLILSEGMIDNELAKISDAIGSGAFEDEDI